MYPRNRVEDPKAVTLKLLAHCRDNDWAGHDPYDALNSELFRRLPFLNFRLPRLVFTQALKRSPINIRALLFVPRTQNPKALALFLASLLKLSKLGLLDDASLVPAMTGKLIALRSKDTPYWCWGYSFPWQTRTIVVPRGAPNLVCTIFVVNALLDAYEACDDSRCLDMAVSAAEYIVNDLYWTEGDGVACFSYPLPTSRTRVHNANLLGAALLCRVARHSGEKKFLEPALKVARYSAAKQREDGSWDYGEAPTQRWIDNFHTGYNLSGLRSIGRDAGTPEFESRIRRGFEFYRRHFFREDGAPRYFHNRTYPIDVHCVAQSILTLLEFQDLDEGNVRLARSVFEWARTHMWDERGYFYYRVLPVCTIKTSYMRWSQAWMLLALTTLLEQGQTQEAVKELCAP
ncbi:MAG TPA: hypothetical protein VJW76_01295 [Verrucomicrobiae bacterium]|nr:hypothetical protein [Verrucomicrobiae bacterium]